MSICWGYAKPKRTLWSSQGCNDLYNNMCVPENEERMVGYQQHRMRSTSHTYRRVES
jgi:hypothetical protein